MGGWPYAGELGGALQSNYLRQPGFKFKLLMPMLTHYPAAMISLQLLLGDCLSARMQAFSQSNVVT